LRAFASIRAEKSVAPNAGSGSADKILTDSEFSTAGPERLL